MSKTGHNYVLMLNVAISVFSLFLVLIFTLKPLTIPENFSWRKPIIGSIFSLICVFGVLAALFPNKCSQTFHFQKENESTSHKIRTVAHHPDCGKFSAHMLRIEGRTICAACTGLLLGALLTIHGIVFYFFGDLHIGRASVPVILIGIVGVILGFLQFKLRNFARLTLNVSFVLGAFLILTGVDELTKSLFADLFLIAFTIFWVFTRIQISQWDHKRICNNCKSSCEFREMKKRQV